MGVSPTFSAWEKKHVLMFSPQGISADGYKNRNLFQSGYLVGKWNKDESFNIEQHFEEMDHGHDFYAPQSFIAPDGRRIVYGWLSMWESPMPEKADGWAGMLSLPREMTLDGNQRLRMNPVKELKLLRSKLRVWDVTEIKDKSIQVETCAEAVEVNLELSVSRSNAEKYGISLGKGLNIYVDNQSQRLVLERNYPEHGLSGYRSVPLPASDNLDLRIFIDSSSVEVFVNSGEYTLSSRIYPEQNDRGLFVFSQNGQAWVQQAYAWDIAG